MKIFAFFFLFVLAISHLTSADKIIALNQSINAIFAQVGLPKPKTIMPCLDSSTADNIYDFISTSLLKGSKGNVPEVISLTADLRKFYETVSDTVKNCLTKNEQLLQLNYNYGINFLPKAEADFASYTKSYFLNIHQAFGVVNSLWTNNKFDQAGKSLSQYAHTVFPIIKKVIKGAWVTNVASTALDSLQNIKDTVRQCNRAGLNTIFVVVYNNARTIYPSEVMNELIGIKQQEKFVGRDPLLELIQAAKQYKIEVHAWFQYGFSSSYSAQGGPIIAKKPEWKALDSNGNLVVKNGFDWLNGFHPQVQQFMIDLFKEVITTYNVDGVQGDDRLPALPSIAGYQPYTIQQYKKDHKGQNPPSDHLQKSWIQWRVARLNAFMKRLYTEVKTINYNMYLSTAPSPYPWSQNEYLQDWPTWVKYGWVDAVIPQCYRYDINAYSNVVSQQLSYFVNPKVVFGSGILLNIGDYVANTTYLSGMIEYNRRKSVKGETFFYYEGVKKQIQWFQSYYKKQTLQLAQE